MTRLRDDTSTRARPSRIRKNSSPAWSLRVRTAPAGATRTSAMRATALSWLREQPSSSGTSASRVIFSFCFTRKPKNERSWPLPLLGSGIEPSSMRPISSIIEPPQSRACRLEPVESARIAAEDLLFLGLADVPAVLDLVERARVRIIPVREVRGVHDLVLADPLERLGQEPLVGLAREVDGPAGHVLARPLLERRRLAPPLGALVVHALHPVRRPPAARLEERHAEPRELFGHALEDHRGELAHLPEGVRARVRLDETREQVDAGAAQVRAGSVDADHDVQTLGFFVDSVEAGIPEHVLAVGGEHRADEAELAYRPLQLDGRRVGVLHRQQRDRLQSRADLDEVLVQERVVGPAERHRPLAIAQEGDKQAERRIEHGLVDAALVERPQPRLGIARPVAERPEQPPVPPIPRIEERAAGPPAIRLVEILHDLVLSLGDVAVGVEDGHRVTSVRDR